MGFILLTGCVFAQHETDSLESLVKSAPADTARVELLNRLVTALREKDNNKALFYAREACALADSLGFKKGLNIALENLGWIKYRKGDYSSSLELSTRALLISEELHDSTAIGRCLVNMAAIHYEQKQFPEAIRNLKKAFAVAQKTGDGATMSRAYNDIAYVYLSVPRLDSAFVNAKIALKLSESTADAYMNAFARRTLGDIYLKQGRYAEALAQFNACLDLSEAESNTFIKASVLLRMGKIFSELGDYDKALSYLSDNIAMAKQFGFKDELERTYKIAADIYYKKNDLKKAYAYQSAYIDLHDSLYNQRSSEQIALMQIRFDSELKQAQIELLTKDAALKAEQINNQQVWIYFYVGCLSLLSMLVFVFFYIYRINRKARISLQEKNREIGIQTDELLNLNSTKDKLFSIISHDLRSPVASLRAMIDLAGTSGLSQEQFIDLSKTVKRNLDSVYQDLDNLLLWAQTQLNGLQATPETIDLYQFVEEKTELYNNLAGKKEIRLINHIQPGTCVIADKNHVNLVFRNLIANAIKFNHRGGSISLSSTAREDHYEISVADSGIGISNEDMEKLFNAQTHFSRPGTHKEKGIGIGLLLTKEFVEKNNGRIWVNSEMGKGTIFTFTLKANNLPVYS